MFTKFGCFAVVAELFQSSLVLFSSYSERANDTFAFQKKHRRLAELQSQNYTDLRRGPKCQQKNLA